MTELRRLGPSYRGRGRPRQSDYIFEVAEDRPGNLVFVIDLQTNRRTEYRSYTEAGAAIGLSAYTVKQLTRGSWYFHHVDGKDRFYVGRVGDQMAPRVPAEECRSPFVCPVCDRWYYTQNNLNVHLGRTWHHCFGSSSHTRGGL